MPDTTQRLTRMSIDVGDEQVELERIESTETLGRPFVVHADIISPLEIDLQPHLGKPASLGVLEDEELLRHFHGLVTAGEYRKETTSGHHYRLTIQPWTYYLAQNVAMAIFQDLTVVAIIKQVIEAAGISDVDYTRLSKPRVPRGYCVQYKESDFAFISRLMEEEGIYYFFRHDADRHVMVLCEGPKCHQPGKPPKLKYNANSVSVFTADSKSRFSNQSDFLQTWIERVRSTAEAKVTYRDFDFESPDQPLTAEATGQGAHPGDDREIFHYPGRYTREQTGREEQQKTGQERGQVLLDAQRAGRRTFTGTSQSAALTCGSRVDVEDHPAARMNAGYLITSTFHSIASESYRSGSQDQEEDAFNVRFEAIPAETSFQPPHISPRPVVTGLESAIVTGPSGETIFTDQYGRVKVRFHWDRAKTPGEQSTCWIRVSQTGGLGNLVLPRVGHEVLVDFLNGDPDRPLVVGRVFNRSNMPIYDLPANKTRALWRTKRYGEAGQYPESEGLDTGAPGANEIRFEDKGGQEELFLHAERDMNSRIRFDETHHVGHNQDHKVGLDRTATIGRDESKLIKRNRGVHVVGTDTLLVDKALSIESKTKITLRVKNSIVIISPEGILIQAPVVEVQATAEATINSPGNTRLNGGASLLLNGGVTNINPEGVTPATFGSAAPLGPAAGEGGS
ncbi:MAG: type VI secretion system tip protein TssI/VgrG [Pseudomonadota bacterium]